MNNPRILIRPDDLEEFIEVEPDLFSNKKLVEEFPENLHYKWSYDFLIEKEFAEKKVIEIEQLFIPAYPEIIYYLPSGFPGKKIKVTECPIEGVNARLVNE